MLLTWRFHSSRIFFALGLLLLSQGAIALFGSTSPGLLLATVRALGVVIPIDFVLIAWMQERGFTAESMGPVALLLFVESIIVAAVCRTAESSSQALQRHNLLSTISFPEYVWVIVSAAGVLLLGRFLFTRKPADSALLWSLCAFFLSLEYAANHRLAMVYSATAACILSISIIESSYLLAYHDELTSLPSRRAFNDALLRLREPFSIAVVDIDHFKRFNDTWGHDTGDQVLRLVASNLARVSGGGCAYRCGGEEFTILFPGKGTSEVVEHLERLRENIEASEFRMRGNDRRQTQRGPDRRNERSSRRSTKGQAIRELAPSGTPQALSVTVSIGVASAAKGKADPDRVLKSADKALYRAKANGRNRVETAGGLRRPTVKAAGIA
jgi:diguanylate cyclase (GGDEF)-like protein